MKIEKFVLNRQGVRELLKSPEMDAVLRTHADETYGAIDYLQEEYAVKRIDGGSRVYYSIAAQTPHARNANAKYNTLLKALR